MTSSKSQDGHDHINIYSQGATKLGRFLSNFAHSPILTEDGRFNSIEGYWYWLGCKNNEREILRTLSGYEAKRVGRSLGTRDWCSDSDFKRKICEAIRIKLLQNPWALIELKNSALPLRHYYIYSGKVVEPRDGQWIIDFIESLRGTK